MSCQGCSNEEAKYETPKAINTEHYPPSTQPQNNYIPQVNNSYSPMSNSYR